MDILGTTTPEIWNTMKYIATETKMTQQLQTKACPYIVAHKVTDKQFLVITGLYKKGRIEIHIKEVRHPSLKEKDKQPIQESDWEQARVIANILFCKAALYRTDVPYVSN